MGPTCVLSAPFWPHEPCYQADALIILSDMENNKVPHVPCQHNLGNGYMTYHVKETFYFLVTLWGLNKTAFYGSKCKCIFWRWNPCILVKKNSLTFDPMVSIDNKHWFRWWCGTDQLTTRCLNQWWPGLLMHIQSSAVITCSNITRYCRNWGQKSSRR